MTTLGKKRAQRPSTLPDISRNGVVKVYSVGLIWDTQDRERECGKPERKKEKRR